jgi:serine/threonine-protein kinase HipA
MANSRKASIDLYRAGAWHNVGAVTVADSGVGVRASGRFEYDLDYLDRFPDLGASDARAVSCRYPVGYEPFEEGHWPPFLLDLIPSGAARRYWEARFALPNTESSDWDVLLSGAANPPGNLRVANALDHFDHPSSHPGFPRSDILDRAADFIEYAHRSGAPVSGSTGAGGDSPKFLLREDFTGNWHADGVLPDERTRHCWLVKFPRTRDAADRLILEAEAGYHRVAVRFGVRTHGTMTWERDCLFVPRFDRSVRSEHVERFGFESLCSLAGVAEFGPALPKEQLAAAVARFATDKRAELHELLRRDVLDVALGNTDNHPRNTSVLKRADGHVELSPLYDFAPMFLDPRGIARVCRWADRAAYPDWSVVVVAVERLGLAGDETRRWLRDLAGPVAGLSALMRDSGVPEVVTAGCEESIARVARSLEAVAA